MRILVTFALGGCLVGSDLDQGATPEVRSADPPSTYRKLYSEHLGNWSASSASTMAEAGIWGTDLGASFERDGELVFLFGDSVTIDGTEVDADSVAVAPIAYPAAGLPRLDFARRASGRFLPMRAPGIALGSMNVPVEGTVIDGRTFVFFSTGWSGASQMHSHSVLAHTDGDLGTFVIDHVVASSKFVNVSVIVEGGSVWIYGSGPYRKSAVYLAHAPAESLGARSSWRYFTDSGFSANEADATPLTSTPCVGELSVRRHPTAPLYLMAYNCDAEPSGIQLHVASTPTGPFSAPIHVFDGWADGGYEHFMHARRSFVGYDDGLSDPGNDELWGGVYGPYIVPAWSSEVAPGVHSIVYTLSTWNPYQVHLVRTVIAEPGRDLPRARRGVGLPRAALANPTFATGDVSGWSSSGGPFRIFMGPDGTPHVTTFADGGDATTGTLWQDITVDASTHELAFAVHGGDATVELWRGFERVRTTRGRRDNAEAPVVWRLDEFHGETVRLVIRDELTGPWGFVGTSGFTLR